jgi:hypothetical protein
MLALAITLAVSHASGQATRSEPSPVDALKISGPETLLDLDTLEMKGVPTRLAWAPDGASLYVRVSRFDRWFNETASHSIVGRSTRKLTGTNGEPPWATRYWVWKSAPASPAADGWRLVFEAREEQVRTTNVPRGADIGGFMADATGGYDELAQKAVLANQKARFETLTLSGHLIDQTINTSLIPGRKFGWAPAPRELMAFAGRDGRLVLMDRDGRTRVVKDTRNVLLPAWSEDGQYIAFIERVRSDEYALRTVRIE